jgi:DNA topoisomerase I
MKDRTSGQVLVLAEKPDAARKIAAALSIDGRLSASNSGSVMEIPTGFDGSHYVVCSALGHLYELTDLHKKRKAFPVMDIEWVPRSKRSGEHGNAHSGIDALVSRKIEEIRRLSLSCSRFVNACDYDSEGEAIGFNVLKFATLEFFPQIQILRAKFSTLTSEEIRQSFRELTPLGRDIADAGRLRHVTDFLWGVNFSRALTMAANRDRSVFANISMGRVQGPTLGFVVEREKSRLVHVPVPSWQVSARPLKSGHEIEAIYVESPIQKYSKALLVYEAVLAAQRAKVEKVQKDLLSVPPRYPFDLGELQRESYRLFKISPKLTLSIAQELYQEALISYPRTDSQKLPERIGAGKIFDRLTLNPSYTSLTSSLISDPKRRFRPYEGPRDDPAHPAIYPTGEIPKRNLSSLESKIYDLVVRRFLNAFAPNELVEKVRILFNIATYLFSAEGSSVKEKGWSFYYPFTRNFSDSLEVSFSKSEEVEVINTSMKEMYDLPPPRFSEATLLAHMEKEGLGTKATRAETIDTLQKREYIVKSKLELLPALLGQDLVENLETISPTILSSKTTKDLELKLEAIRTRAATDVDFLADMLDSLKPTVRLLRNKKIQLSIDDAKSIEYSRSLSQTLDLGTCPVCGKGTLRLIRSPKTNKRFIRCSNGNGNCNVSSPALPTGRIVPSSDVCPKCQWPIISVLSFKGKPSRLCSNFNCILKARTR